ncbi:hydantoinase/oxoprolinase family protein [bacterium]|nr:hydantoinase/oxoprolinase family protein [bacterium]
MKKLRVGIDVGGTFTHAVAVDNDTLKVAAHAVTPTTHRHEDGVAAGIAEVFGKLRDKLEDDSQIVFLAHSTTQATNALLEGDVARVGVLALASGLESVKVKSDTDAGRIELSPGKYLESENAVFNPEEPDFEAKVKSCLQTFKDKGIGAIVAAQSFSVDDASGEEKLRDMARDAGFPSCATHEMSGLYGLGVRTGTAVLNAGILPKMINTALMTAKALKVQSVEAPLMIMRSDGGVMNLDEVLRRPVLTLLSGPAAGIAACLMFLKASDALFLEVGGTSTDICLLKDGKAAVRSAVIGGHSTYLRTLDSRTVGIAGGSLIGSGAPLSVGPRSAHLAGFAYCAFAEGTEELSAEALQITEEAPFAGDKPYYAVILPDGRKAAPTLTCAANLLGLVPEDGYSRGNKKFIAEAFKALAEYRRTKGAKIDTDAYKAWRASRKEKAEPDNLEGEALAYEVLRKASESVIPVLEKLLADYKMEGRSLKLIGGGGGAAAVVPFTAQAMGLPFEIAERAEVISSIGAALAMVRESLERNIVNPTAADIQRLRSETEQAVIQMGADPESVRIDVEVDAQKNLVRAVAQGAIAFSNTALNGAREISEAERLENLNKAGLPGSRYKLLGGTGIYYIYEAKRTERVFFGLIKKEKRILLVTDRFGSIRLQLPEAKLEKGGIVSLKSDLERILRENTVYGDAGALLPALHIAALHKLCDLSTLSTADQIIGLAESELNGLAPEAEVFFLINKA